jgi:acyl-CoA dehydrogenase
MHDVAGLPFAELLKQVHRIGREALAPHADAVDRDARFPQEAFTALKAARLLGAYVPRSHGGLGLGLGQVAQLGEVLGQYCASSAMIFAMHQIQVACIVHHALEADFFADFARQIAAQQLLLASATTEVGIGGDLRSSICALQLADGRFSVTKQAPVLSYAEAADAVLVTCRRHAEAAPGDQLHVLLRRGDYELKPLCNWDTMGFRGTCSSGYTVVGHGAAEQILPAPYADIHAKTMHPVAHITWGSLWVGMAIDALARARSVVRAQARKAPDLTPIGATRLAEADTVLFSMRAGMAQMIAEYEQMLAQAPLDAYRSFSFNIRVNNLKLNCSSQLVDIVSRALSIAGIEAYRNDSKVSLCRHLRDAHGTVLMVSNDRVLGLNAKLQIVQKDD